MPVVQNLELFRSLIHDLFVLFFAVARLIDFWVSKLEAFGYRVCGLDIAVHIFHEQLSIQSLPTLEGLRGCIAGKFIQ